MNKWNVVYPHNLIVLSPEKEWNTDSHCNTNEPWKHYAKWNRPETNSHILHDSNSMKYSKQANPETESIQ